LPLNPFSGEAKKMASLITDMSTQLTPGARYLLYFDLPFGLPVDISRKISDAANFSATFADRFGKAVDFELLGTTVAEKAGLQGQDQLVAQIRITGTPLLAVVPPIVAVCLIVAAVFIVIEFRHAIEVTAQSAATGITTITQGAADAVNTIATGIQSIGTGLGGGLNYALPIIGVGVSVLALIVFFGYVKAPR
jgi:hypothetical protein